jgi:hypothetical protein
MRAGFGGIVSYRYLASGFVFEAPEARLYLARHKLACGKQAPRSAGDRANQSAQVPKGRLMV